LRWTLCLRSQAVNWAVLPSHPLWHAAGLGSLFAELGSSQQLRALWSLAAQPFSAPEPEFPSFRISWKNIMKHLFLMLRK